MGETSPSGINNHTAQSDATVDQFNTIPASLTQPSSFPAEPAQRSGLSPLWRLGLYLAALAALLMVLKRLFR